MALHQYIALPNAPRLSVHTDRPSLGRAAAEHVVTLLSDLIAQKGAARVVFACAPSQDQFLESLLSVAQDRIDWSKVTGFHMDEYVGLPRDHHASFRNYLKNHFLSKVYLKEFHAIGGEAMDPNAECVRYASLLDAAPIDLICLGIGENGHLAFNDPPVADFDDPVSTKVVELDTICRQQQVNDGCFARLDDVPRHAITLTIPVFRRAAYLSVVVPGERKATAVLGTYSDAVSTSCPSTILRTHANATLFVDKSAASKLTQIG
jgi:glucosamine-6-phosphate deaminase